jgi:hypothetical protein
MADPSENILPVVCKNCSHHLEVKVPDYFVKVIKERCTCGMTESALQARYLALAAISLFFCAFGSCAAYNYFSYKSVEAISGEYKVEKVPSHNRLWMDPEYRAVKPEAQPQGKKPDAVEKK